MWFEKKVSRKEFLELHEDFLRLAKLVSNQEDSLLRYLERTIKLEAANNCRDGKHEWVDDNVLPHTKLGGNYVCKHCGIKKDEWEKPQGEAAHAAAEHASKCVKRAQPKSKKGKK